MNLTHKVTKAHTEKLLSSMCPQLKSELADPQV